MRLFIALLLLAAITTFDQTQEPKETKPASKVPVTLEHGERTSKLAPRYSPPGRQLKLQAKAHPELKGVDHLETRVNLGPNKNTAGLLLVVARSEKDKPYDLLFVQDQPAGKLSEKPISIKPSTVRNKFWSTFDDVPLQVNHAKPGDPAALEPFPVSFWIVVEKENDVPDVIRISRRGFLHGEVKLGDDMFDVILSDSNTDGVFATGDWWELRSKSPKADAMRTVGDYAWAGGKAWKLELTGTNGRSAQLVSFDPGMTEEEDTIKRDRLRADRMAPRAAKPVAFRKDVDETLKEVTEKKAVCFIKFETDWCMPCKQMTELVFTAKDVADASNGITCLIVDGDARKDLTEKHKVKAYPTGILLDTDGNEIARYVGYQGVKETTAFLKKGKK
ncbi:MAG: thioredoxin family protein [Gemmatales bacterium]